ncbi:MAG: hypothetical protein QXD05_00020 [Candidatus Pacearchaeota archaeon]
MTASNHNLLFKIRPIIEVGILLPKEWIPKRSPFGHSFGKRLKEYEKYHKLLCEEERALVRLIITSIVLSERLRNSYAAEKVNLFTKLN